MLQNQTIEQRPAVWLHEEQLQALGLPYRVIQRGPGDIVLAELEEAAVPAEWMEEAVEA